MQELGQTSRYLFVRGHVEEREKRESTHGHARNPCLQRRRVRLHRFDRYRRRISWMLRGSMWGLNGFSFQNCTPGVRCRRFFKFSAMINVITAIDHKCRLNRLITGISVEQRSSVKYLTHQPVFKPLAFQLSPIGPIVPPIGPIRLLHTCVGVNVAILVRIGFVVVERRGFTKSFAFPLWFPFCSRKFSLFVVRPKGI